MKCKICGAELGIDEKICHECGNPIEEQNPSGTEENNQGEEEWTEAEAEQTEETELTEELEDGLQEVIPEEPNSYKFETFIFDSFNYVDDIAILRGNREIDFAPVKNKEGVDSPETAKELYNNYWKNNQE